MAFWRPAQNKFYIPPTPITRAISTDEYVHRTDIFYHASSERLLMVGHPFFEIPADDDSATPKVPKVSPNQYRVFKLKLPNPNEFVFPDKDAYNPDEERLVWACRGIEIGRGGPLGIPVTGSPFFNKLSDVENPPQGVYAETSTENDRRNMAMDCKQTQLLIIGNSPPIGEYWTRAKPCGTLPNGACPPIELANKVIEDGQMCDIGFGNIDAKALQPGKSELPLDSIDEVICYPDYHKMTRDLFGDYLWFFARREQMYARHFFDRAGVNAERVPERLFLKGANNNTGPDDVATLNSYVYSATPSGSLVSTDTQFFNRPYWLNRAQGLNNGVCWNNEMFVTVCDNTRGTHFTINANGSNGAMTDFTSTTMNEYLRHVEEFEISCIFQLCRVRLSAEILAYIHTMNSYIIDKWDLNIQSPPNDNLHEVYRYIESLATKCPDQVKPPEDKDPWKDYKFWEVDLTERFSEQLDQYNLGRRFLFQAGVRSSLGGRQVIARAARPRTRPVKRKRSVKTSAKVARRS
ncbi:L1 protein [Eumops bonariensis papillomavirus type 2]|nr:L1 protein [Eumops bonariensis papillomavirus type 2]